MLEYEERKEQQIKNFIRLLKPQITDETLFRKEFYFHTDIVDNDEVNGLVASEIEEYTESGTLKLAELLWDAGSAPPPVYTSSHGSRVHVNWKVHRLTCLYLYERAAEHGSAEGYFRAASLYSWDPLYKDSQKAFEYYEMAEKLGYDVGPYKSPETTKNSTKKAPSIWSLIWDILFRW